MLQFAKMKKIIAAILSLPLLAFAEESPAPQFDARAAERFARLALAGGNPARAIKRRETGTAG
jgi:hypothetical protein